MGYYDRFNKGGKKPKHQRSEKQKWVDKLDRLMSVYIRMRDSREFHYKYFRCISCGRILPIDQADNGHYCGRTHMSLRFDTRNQNAECKRCNRFSSDHLIGYRKNLVMKLGRLAYLQKHPHVPLDMEEVKRLGEQQVDLLEVMKHQAKNWSVFELQELYKYYALCDVFIMPTLEDNWCLVIPEAMACGKPVACSIYNGGHYELVQDRKVLQFPLLRSYLR